MRRGMSINTRSVIVALLLTAGIAFADPGKEKLCGYVPDIGTKEKAFSMAIWGDAQVAFWEEGYDFSESGRSGPSFKSKFKTVNPRLRQCVELTNRLNPAFVVTVGDNIHGYGEWEHYRTLVEICKPLEMPLYLVVGNHDHWNKTFKTNPYGDREYGNFLWAQKQLGAPELVNYSFDAGDWHVVCWAQAGHDDQQMHEHPEFYDWLDADLAKNKDRPTLFFTHHPPLPVGRRHFDAYGGSATRRGRLVGLVTKYGNVRYAFFGHVHNTVGSVPVISWQYKGTAFITLPNTANIVRLYHYHETAKSSWGAALLKLDGPTCTSMTLHTLAGETITLSPEKLPEYDDEVYAYIRPETQWPAGESLRNGDFGKDLDGWFVNHLLPYDTPPIQKREIRTDDGGGKYLHLYTKGLKLGGGSGSFICDVRQAVLAPPADQWPQLSFRYRILSTEYPSPKCGTAFAIVTGYGEGKSHPSLRMIYNLGEPIHGVETGSYVRGSKKSVAALRATPVLDRWTPLTLNVRSDYEKLKGQPPWGDPKLHKIIVTLGVWNANHGRGKSTAEIGASFDDVVWQAATERTPPSAGFEKTEWVSQKRRQKGRKRKKAKAAP